MEQGIIEYSYGYLLDPSTKVIVRRKKCFVPVVAHIQSIVDSFTKHLNMLGLGTVNKGPGNLHAFMAEHDAAGDA